MQHTSLYNCCQYCGCCVCIYCGYCCYQLIKEETNTHPSLTSSPVSIGSYFIQGNIQSCFNFISIRWNQLKKSFYVPWLGGCCLMPSENIFSDIMAKNKLLINEIRMFVLYQSNNLCWILMALANWNISTRVDMSV